MRGNPHAAFDVAGAGNVAWSRWCATRKRKGEPTGNTNIDLNRRVSPRPYCQFLVGIAGENDVDTPPARALWLNTRPLISISEIRPSNDPAEQLASPPPKN